MEIDNVITNSDLVNLNELFYMNYNIYNVIDNIIIHVDNKSIKDILSRVKNMHEDHMYFIISSLKKENYLGDKDE